jgi:hypothetical protein
MDATDDELLILAMQMEEEVAHASQEEPQTPTKEPVQAISQRTPLTPASTIKPKLVSNLLMKTFYGETQAQNDHSFMLCFFYIILRKPRSLLSHFVDTLR